jgi:hypothetical protein
MRTEKEIRERLERLKKQKLTEGPYIERQNIAWHAAKQVLEWVLEEKNSWFSII